MLLLLVATLLAVRPGHYLNALACTRTPAILLSVSGYQRAAGDTTIVGLMLESNIVAGSQPAGPRDTLAYGVSITDGCIGWEETEQLLVEAHTTLG